MKLKTIMKNKKTWLAAGALALVMSVSVGGAIAYFTGHTEAEGKYEVQLDMPLTEIHEEIVDLDKHITITNTGETECYVRAMVIYGDNAMYNVNISGTNWIEGLDGYWYYTIALAPGETTADELVADVTAPANEQYDFDIVVIQENTPTWFEGSNGPDYAGWDREAITDIGYNNEGGE